MIHSLQAGGKFFDLRGPVPQQRGGRHQQVRGNLCGTGLFHQQQRQHLDRLAEAHVVGQAGPEAKARQQVQPLRSCFLVGAQRPAQHRSGIDVLAIRRAQGSQRLLQPGAGDHTRPVGVGGGRIVAGNGGAGQHPHRFGKAEAIAGRKLLGRLELLHRASHPCAVDLDPFAAQQHEVLGAGEQGCDLDLGQRLAFQHHVHAKIQQTVQSDGRWRAAADCCGHLRSGGTAGAPGRGHADDDPGPLELGDAVQQARRVAGSPTQGMEDIPSIDHLLQPDTVFSGALNRQKQGQQLVAVRRASIFAQRLAKGNMLRPGLGGEAGGVGRHEGEGPVGIAAIFRQVEMDPADQVPGRIQAGQESLQVCSRGGKGRGERARHLVPQRGQDIPGQILGPRHHRRGQHQR